MVKLIVWFDGRFAQLYLCWRELIQKLEPEDIYRRIFSGSQTSSLSCGEHVVQSARVVEQAFGGITANLWDDPFEWTLPETLTTSEKLLAYFDEVEATRQRGFALFKSDEDLLKEIMTPSGEMQLASLLLDTLVRAGHRHLSAIEVFEQLEKVKRRTASHFAANLAP